MCTFYNIALSIIFRLEFVASRHVYVTKTWSEMPKPKLSKPICGVGLPVKNTRGLFEELFKSNVKSEGFWPKSSLKNWRLRPNLFTIKRNWTKAQWSKINYSIQENQPFQGVQLKTFYLHMGKFFRFSIIIWPSS